MSKITRRRFLAVGAAASAPLILPSRVLGRAGNPGPNDQIAVGCIGLGPMGNRHRGAVTDYAEDARVVALCDVDTERLAAAATHYDEGEVGTYTDYRNILDRNDIDAVTIGTPDHWHGVQTVHACLAGKDVYVEKPASKTIAEGKAMVAAARENNCVIQVGSQGRSFAPFYPICNYIRNGELGEITRVDFWHGRNPTGGDAEDQEPPDHLDWDMWLGPARWVPYNPDRCHFTFRWFLEYGGGNVRDRGAHVLSNLQWFLDIDDRGPARVTATGTPPAAGNYNVPRDMEVTWEYEDPELVVTWGQPGQTPDDSDFAYGGVFHGTEGNLTVEGGCGAAGPDYRGTPDEHVREYEPPPDGERAFRTPHHQDHAGRHSGMILHILNWLDCVKSREEPIMPIGAGHRVASACILANVAYQLGRPLEWDPVEEWVVGDEEANRWLHEPGRGPWHV